MKPVAKFISLHLYALLSWLSFLRTAYIYWLPDKTQLPTVSQSLQYERMISGFCHKVAENRALLGYYVANSDNHTNVFIQDIQ
jgi:hypothetical protein